MFGLPIKNCCLLPLGYFTAVLMPLVVAASARFYFPVFTLLQIATHLSLSLVQVAASASCSLDCASFLTMRSISPDAALSELPTA